jgi:hypothetical protein
MLFSRGLRSQWQLSEVILGALKSQAFKIQDLKPSSPEEPSIKPRAFKLQVFKQELGQSQL